MTMAEITESPKRTRLADTGKAASGLSVPLAMGPLRGQWWQLGSGGKVVRILLGTYEREQTERFQRLVQPGEQVLDIGAAAGYYTLLGARLVGPTGRVVAFEPEPVNLRYLRAHVRQNRLSNVRVLPIAVSDSQGVARFGGGTGTGTGRLCAHGCHEVPIESLDHLAESEDLAPQHMKIDVEGAELAVLRGGKQLIERYRPTIFLSTHDVFTPGLHDACCDLLTSWDYRLEPIIGPSVKATTELLCTPN